MRPGRRWRGLHFGTLCYRIAAPDLLGFNYGNSVKVIEERQS
jgi:hypothetical protein